MPRKHFALGQLSGEGIGMNKKTGKRGMTTKVKVTAGKLNPPLPLLGGFDPEIYY